MNLNLLEALEQLEEEKGISKDEIMEILEKALVSAYKKNFGTSKNVEVKIDRMTGDIQLYQVFDVVENVTDELTQISLEDARKIDPLAEIGKKIYKKISVKEFGRIAAQTAKQVLIQRIRELEKERQYEHYSELAGSVTTCEVIRVTADWADIRVGKIETRLMKRDWIPGETIKPGDLIKVYVVDVLKDRKGPKILGEQVRSRVCDWSFQTRSAGSGERDRAGKSDSSGTGCQDEGRCDLDKPAG